ncbi:signal peptidase I [Alkaliphilus metalliredigens QYMF]|uniref:Signal peptidase I n=1 Tax=Alkaliphilus metalliredigens (strain QYMF) TaxID=293826 RepID=A6TU91_ALKMQ|nr:signal peptidase I [Alkaliphilus metalliredigens]ABR49759.1 signal peptidase I [Alkaliphilus metalliredigens QYMF]
MSKIKSKPLEWLQALIVAIFIAMLIEHFLFSFAVVQGQSMYPTLNSHDRLLVVKLNLTERTPRPGDLIVFSPPSSQRQNELFVKRVVAIESDYFTFEEGELYINEERVQETYINGESYIQRNYRLNDGQVPTDNVLVLGDNRNDSNDSRSFGYVDVNQIKGKVLLRVWPLNELKAFVNP